MLPDLFLRVTLPRGGPEGALVARDVPACLALYDWPGPDADGDDHMAWQVAVLTRVVLHPRLTREDVLALAEARHEPTEAYLRAVGWWKGGQARSRPAEPILAPLPGIVLPGLTPVPLAVLQATPHALIARRLVEAGRAFHLDPWSLWLAPLSELCWRWGVLDAAAETPPRPTGLPDDEHRQIGLEEE